MDRPAAAAIVLSILALLLVLMVLGWRARSRRQLHLTAPGGVSADAGAPRARFDGFYVATTIADDPLNRVVADRLGFRGRVQATVFDTGIELAIAGRDPLFIGADGIRGIDTATWAIDRVVEPDGLARIRWALDGPAGLVDVDSYLRLPNAEFIAAAAHVDPHRTTSKSGSNDK